jgi:hypothetical protein
MFSIKPKLPIILISFGERGLVTTKDDIQGKLKNRVLISMFVVNSIDHASIIYRILNLNTKRIIQTRYVVRIGIGYND